ncbi:MAG: hypothetical protein AAB600_02935 [Patescibacteria group bacterium]
MDLNKLNQLDPKLKETYERVMGTAIQPTPRTSPFMPKPANPFPPTQPVTPQPIIQKPTIQSQPSQPIQSQSIQQPIQTFKAKPLQAQPAQAQPIQRQQAQSLKKKNKILPVLVALGVIVLLIGYALFWIKIFNLKIPFLPF